ncbi:MAG: chemotaxis protein CheW [Clostridiales bacterium]|nr:chemotaxis protein CheW [Clostridiales bacterium]
MEFKPVVCNLDTELYGIDINCVRGIEKTQEIVRVPNTASYIKGIMNLRGDIIPVYSLRQKFGLPDIKGENAQYIIVRIGKMPLAIEVDGVGEIFDADASQVIDAPPIILSEKTKYVDKVVNANGRLILIINIDKLLDDDELYGASALIDAATK